MRAVVLGFLATSFAAGLSMLYVSSLNYPGGEAICLFYEVQDRQPCSVHMDVKTCMEGATRFIQSNACNFSKEEGLGSQALKERFDYLITEKIYDVDIWKTEAIITGFDRVVINWNLLNIGKIIWTKARGWEWKELYPMKVFTSKKLSILSRIK